VQARIAQSACVLSTESSDPGHMEAPSAAGSLDPFVTRMCPGRLSAYVWRVGLNGCPSCNGLACDFWFRRLISGRVTRTTGKTGRSIAPGQQSGRLLTGLGRVFLRAAGMVRMWGVAGQA
jgi:hypothetical protein